MNILRNVMRLFLVGLIFLTFGVTTSQAANKVLKIGHIGVMSGPAASWGLINKYAALAGAEIINEDGGFEIGGEKYDIEIVSLDTKQDPRVAIAGAERLVYSEGIKYIIGPNVDDTTRAVLPVPSTSAMVGTANCLQRRARILHLG